MEDVVPAVGSVEAQERVVLQPEVPGLIESIHFEEGQLVRKGDVLFREFAVATAGLVVISAFVALTLTPTLCARLLRHEPETHGRIYQALESFSDEIQSGSTESLQVVILAALVVFMILAAQFESLRRPLGVAVVGGMMTSTFLPSSSSRSCTS